MSTQTNRTLFDGVLGDEYKILKVIVPHLDAFEDSVKIAVTNFALARPEPDVIRVLEIGCGTGFTTRRLVDASPRVFVTAVDHARNMIDQAREEIADALSRVEFNESDALTFLASLPDDLFDCVASGFSIHNFEPTYRKNLMVEIARVTRKGGLYVNADKFAHDDLEEHRVAYAEQMKVLLRYVKVGKHLLYEEYKKHYAEDDAIRFTEWEQKTLLTNLGYVGIETVSRVKMEATIVAFKK